MDWATPIAFASIWIGIHSQQKILAAVKAPDDRHVIMRVVIANAILLAALLCAGVSGYLIGVAQ